MLIQREIASRMKYIKKLEEQKVQLKYLSGEKEKVSEQLSEYNRYIETVLMNLPLGIAVTRMDDGSPVIMNKNFSQIYGWPKENLLNFDHFFECVHPEKGKREKMKRRVLEGIQSGDPTKMKWQNIEIFTHEGNRKIINAQNIIIPEQNLMVSTVQDVTETIKFQKERDRIFENSVDMVATSTMDGYLLQLNPAWEKTLGWTPEELRSKPFLEFIHPDDLNSTIEATKNLEKGEPALGFENRYLAKDGSYRWLSWNTIPFVEEKKMMGIARDITEEVETMKKLEFQRILNKSVFDTAEVGLCITNEAGYFTKVNEAYSSIYGYSPDELIGERLTKLIPPGQRDDALEVNRKMMSGEMTMAPRTWEVINKKGKHLDVLVSAKVFEVNNEKFQVTSVLDVTQMKSVQRELKQSKEQLKNITDNLPGAVIQYKMKPDGTDELTYVSEGAYSIWGVSAEEAQNDNQKIWSQIDKRDVDKVKKTIENSYKNLTPWSVVYRNNLPDGSVKWIEGTGMPFKQQDGSVIWDSIMIDITSRKEAEEEVRESKALLEKIINSLNEVVLVVNPEEREITLVNDAVEKIFGYKPEEIIGQKTETLHLNHEMYEQFGRKSESFLEKEGVFYTEFQMKHKNGSVLETENIVASIKEANRWNAGVISVIRDVTSRKSTESRLHEYQESLKEMTTELTLIEEKQRKEFAANIHDHLSQLLVISQMKINDLKNQLQIENKQQLEIISKHISEALENSRQITYDLSPPVLYELGLVETMYWFIDKLNSEQNIHADFITNVEKVELPESKLILVFRVIQELVNNALKHAQADNVEIVFKAKSDLFEINVDDDGKGFIMNGALDTKFKKGGFGLFAVKERVNNLGGKFSLNSKPGFGTSVKITVPLIENISEVL
jgi:PAS domain S-box-containing protein